MGRQLKGLRERNGITQADAARIVEVSPQSYGRLEDGRVTKITNLGINALANAFRADDEERRLLLDLAQEIRLAQPSGGGWWRAYADAIPSDFNYYLALEESADRIISWQTTLVPGLLQTREYRRALMWAERPDMPPGEVEGILDMVGKRQDLLTRNDFRFEAILSEAVLRYMVGGPGVVADQFRHLTELSTLQNVSVRIVPFDAQTPIALIARTSFVVFAFPPLPTSRLIEPPVAYMEGLVGDLYLERETEVATYIQIAEKMQRVALSESASRDLVLTTLKEWDK
ncbi:helix-turn-helix transcriptional regulator [Nocardia sp. NPDC049190]|uniref:helix-turn-helix domain-containing protein n=1 Tax=Nocardia sp. NPDC049190 TaxID=3155650 RepID=UPI0033FB0989